MNILTKILQMRNLNIIISDIVIEDLEMLVDLEQEVLENIVRENTHVNVVENREIVMLVTR